MRMKKFQITARNFLKTIVRKFETHSVFNQSTQLGNLNLYIVDPSLQMAMKNFCPSLSEECLSTLNRFGALCGSKELYEIADMAEKHRPSLRQFDINGRRIDVVDYHHSYHQLMDHGIGNGSVAYGFVHASNKCYSHTARAAMIYMENMLEPGHCCPLVMSCAAIPLLTRHSTELGNVLLSKIKTMKYDSRDIAVHEKTGATVGMSMTEKQGGSDVRANTTLAFPIDQQAHGSGCNYRLRGHKWFTSAPMSDAFLTLAKVDGSDALSCFIVPRWLPDGSRNTGFRVMRLKEKLADRANASSEVEYADAWAQMIGQPGQGVKTIIEMLASNITHLFFVTAVDCTLGSAATARRALQHAIHHCQGRKAFGSLLIEQPLMRNLLTDLCVEAEAHTLMAFHMASSFDKAQSSCSPEDQDLFRIGVTVSKYFVTKRLPAFTYECLEQMFLYNNGKVFGGNGFVEDFPMSKLFRQSPLNSIWEGSGNVIALDILRGRNQLPTLLEDIRKCKGADSKVDSYISSLESSLQTVLLAQGQGGGAESQAHARNIADRLAIAMQASALLRFGDAKVAECFIASKVNFTGSGVNYGGHVYTSAQRTFMIERNSLT